MENRQEELDGILREELLDHIQTCTSQPTIDVRTGNYLGAALEQADRVAVAEMRLDGLGGRMERMSQFQSSLNVPPHGGSPWRENFEQG
jgi:hypothetical protein